MFRREIVMVLLWLLVHSFVQAAEGNLLFIAGRGVKRLNTTFSYQTRSVWNIER